MRFQDLLRRDGESVTALSAAIERADEAGAETARRLEALSDERTKALLSDDEKALDRIEAEITKVTRDRDRARLAVQELNRRLSAAQQADRQARLDAIHRVGLKAQHEAVELLRTDYARHAEALVVVARKLAALEAEIADANRQLEAEYDGRIIAGPDEVARPSRGPTKVIPVPVPDGLRLPDPADGGMMLWPEGQDIFGGPALRQDRAA